MTTRVTDSTGRGTATLTGDLAAGASLVLTWDAGGASALVASGTYTFITQCQDRAGNWSAEHRTQVPIVTDPTAPVVNAKSLRATFSVSRHRTVVLECQQNEAGRTEAEIVNAQQQVRRYLGGKRLGAGVSTWKWDGQGTAGVVPLGQKYGIRCRTVDAAGNVGQAVGTFWVVN